MLQRTLCKSTHHLDAWSLDVNKSDSKCARACRTLIYSCKLPLRDHRTDDSRMIRSYLKLLNAPVVVFTHSVFRSTEPNRTQFNKPLCLTILAWKYLYKEVRKIKLEIQWKYRVVSSSTMWLNVVRTVEAFMQNTRIVRWKGYNRSRWIRRRRK